VEWDEDSSFGDDGVDETGGAASISEDFKSFDPPGSGQVSVEITIGKDDTYNTKVTAATVEVYDNVRDVGGAAFGGLMSFCLSPFLFAIGLIVMIVGLVVSSSKKAHA